MHLDFSKWYEVHPRVAAHKTEMLVAAGQLLLVCPQCAVSQTADDVSAGNEVAPARKVTE